jgi:hypothetical protein
MAPATFATLEALVPAFERRGFQVQRDTRAIERPGKLPGDPQTVALILGSVGTVAAIISAVYDALQFHRREPDPAKALPPADPELPVPVRPPVVIRVRWGGSQGDSRVQSEVEAQAVDVEITGLPEDQPVEVVCEREFLQ